MTNADTIKRDLHEMEGECVHINEALYVHCYWDSNAYYLTRECLDCDDNVAIVDVFRREATFMDAIFPEWDAIPDRLSDGAYIWKQTVMLIDAGYDFVWDAGYSIVKMAKDASGGEFIVKKLSCNSVPEHAIALAAIQRWKEGNND